jgi:hypothetical protein
MRGIVINQVLAAGWCAMSMSAQTQVNLGNQSKNVDFQTAPFTKPLKTGASLPATCGQGELFFVTTATAGANIYGCAASNTWTVEGTGGSGGGGAVAVDNNGALAGSRDVVNFIPGSGILNVITDDGTKINVQQGVDSAVVLTRAGDQSGQTLLCSSIGGSGSSYMCAMSPTLSGYQKGMVLNWTPDVNGAGGATTLNVDALGAHSVKLPDGILDPAIGDLIGGKMYPVWFDGSTFRLIAWSATTALAGTQPACSTSTRGRIWDILGANGVKDAISVCAKDATDAYAWRVLY